VTADLRLFWWRPADGTPPNFGDELCPDLVALVSGRPVVYADPSDCQLVALGSVMEHAFRAKRSEPVPIWGTGFIREDSPTMPDRVIPHAIRGPLSASRVDGSPALGDPGLLARYLIGYTVKRFHVGLVPHYTDMELPIARSFGDLVPDSTIISPLQEPREVISQIAACDVVLSSSLHGLIVADSLGVPNVWVELSDNVAGAGYKFRDYLGCFGINDPTPVRVTGAPDYEVALSRSWEAHERPGLDDLIAGLIAAFPELD
jgi:pyruvyltransferase